MFDRTLVVNGSVYPATESLYTFLHRYRRDEGASARLWVDAVCINQHDLAVNSMQVSNMLTMYKKALKVIVWLGEQIERARYALDYLRSGH